MYSYQKHNVKEMKQTTQQQSQQPQQCETKFKHIAEHLSELLEMVKSVALKYKLASIVGLKEIVLELLNEPTIHYLRDINFGRMESDCNAI